MRQYLKPRRTFLTIYCISSIFSFLLQCRMRRKDGRQSDRVREKGKIPREFFRRLTTKEEVMEETSQDIALQTRRSTSKNNWSPKKTGNLLGKMKSPKRLLRDEWVEIRPINRSGDPQVYRMEKISQLAW